VAYSGQQSNIPIDPDRQENLWNPVAEDRGAHGIFDQNARSFSIQLRASMNRGWVVLAGLGVLLSAYYVTRQMQIQGNAGRV
jgi:hypothetical protein